MPIKKRLKIGSVLLVGATSLAACGGAVDEDSQNTGSDGVGTGGSGAATGIGGGFVGAIETGGSGWVGKVGDFDDGEGWGGSLGIPIPATGGTIGLVVGEPPIMGGAPGMGGADNGSER
jgi:hypothetical protein